MLTANTRQYRISVRKLKSLHMFVFVVFFHQRFLGLSRTPARDQVGR